MGSSKKHKDKERDHKRKRKHRSRSRSKEHKPKRRDEKEKKERDTTRGSDRSVEKRMKQDEPTSPARGKSNASLSIEDTNRLRAKLGLKPLDVPGSGDGDAADKPSASDDVHAPPVNWGDMKKTESLKEKMAILKEKRLMNQKLSKVKTLGDSDSDSDDISKWVKKSRKMEKEKVLADKRAKVLQEMDDDFGITNLMDAEFKDKAKDYSAKDLLGLKVEHAMDKFKEGRGIILTLKDQGVLDEGMDTLINVNIIDDEHAAKNVDNKKKKPDYKPYDDPEYDEYGVMKPKNLLRKYDEDIDGNTLKKSFQLGSGGRYDGRQDRRMERIREELRQQGQSLSMPSATIASEYYTPEEAAEKFKKVKKKVRKIRKKAWKADDLLQQVDDTDFGSRTRGRGRAVPKDEPLESLDNDGQAEQSSYAEGTVIDYGHGLKTESLLDDHSDSKRIKLDPSLLDRERMDYDDDLMGPDEDLTGVPVDDEEVQNDFHSALNKARKLKQKRELAAPEKMVERLLSVKEEQSEEEDAGGKIVLNSISEFCRNLGEIPTYGLSGNREEERDEVMDQELELLEQKRRDEEEVEEEAGGWNEVDMIDTQPVEITGEETAVLEEEPIVSAGVGAALSLAKKKGYLEKEVIKKNSAPEHSELAALYYSIEDKRYDDIDEKYRKRDRYSSGVITDFKEKESYRPEIKLEYVDESGRSLNPKEAFRQLSHRFHGKGSGKKKTEKRMKKVEEENLMKQMSSTDTPLNTLSLLKEKQRAEKSPFVILSGNKGFSANTSGIVKP